jgi:hypothetical protein
MAIRSALSTHLNLLDRQSPRRHGHRQRTVNPRTRNILDSPPEVMAIESALVNPLHRKSTEQSPRRHGHQKRPVNPSRHEISVPSIARLPKATCQPLWTRNRMGSPLMEWPSKTTCQLSLCRKSNKSPISRDPQTNMGGAGGDIFGETQLSLNSGSYANPYPLRSIHD